MGKRTIYISVLLKDNMIMAFSISGNLKEYPHDYYKSFIYNEIDYANCDKEYEVKYMEVIANDNDISDDFNNYIFDVFARQFYRQWKIHPNHFGEAAY